jgi:hypothetical protein
MLPFKSGLDDKLPDTKATKLKLGLTLDQVLRKLGVDNLPDERGFLYLPKLGLSFVFLQKKLKTVMFFEPYSESVRGLQIGEGVNTVVDCLGMPQREERNPWKGVRRAWYYPECNLRICFNSKDKITSIDMLHIK